MSDKRYNVFNQIHKALRALLYDTALRIQQTDFDTPAAQETVDAVLLVVNLFDDHAHHEDEYILPMVQATNPALVTEFEEEHVVDHRLSNALRDHTAAWQAAGTAAEKLLHGKAIYYAFNEFIAFNLYHMNKEENILLFTLWKHFTDDDLLAAQGAIIASIKPEYLMIESRWMVRSISNTEMVMWLRGVQLSSPAEVFNMLTSMAQEELPQHRWQKIAAALQLTETAA